MRNKKGQFIKGHKSIPLSESGRMKIILTHKGIKKSEETKRKMKENHIGTLGKKLPRSKEHQQKISDAKKGKRYPKASKAKVGSKNPMWKGGIAGGLNRLRCLVEYKLWRKAVLDRDGYRCVWCGSDKQLEVDHIKSMALYPELRLAIDNGRTLCKSCHITTDNYGGKCLILNHG